MTLLIKYVKIEKNNRFRSKIPIVTVGVFGYFYLNKFIMKNYFNKTNRIVFLWDERKRRLAIKSADAYDKDSYSLRSLSKHKSTCGAVIAARGVVKRIKIDYTNAQRYQAVWRSENKLLEIQF